MTPVLDHNLGSTHIANAKPTPTSASPAHTTCADTYVPTALPLAACAEALADCAAADELLDPDVDEVAIMLATELELAARLLDMVPAPPLDAILLVVVELGTELVVAVPLPTVTSVALLAIVVVGIDEESLPNGIGVILFENEEGGSTVVDSDSKPGAVVMADAVAVIAKTDMGLVSFMAADLVVLGIGVVFLVTAGSSFHD